MVAKTQITPIHPCKWHKKCILLFHWLYDSLQPMRSLAVADWLSMFAAERIWSSHFGNQAGSGHKLALVFGLNIKPIHSAVDLGNQSAAACKFFCMVCERHDTCSTSLSIVTCCAGGDLLCRLLKLVIKCFLFLFVCLLLLLFFLFFCCCFLRGWG